MASRATYRLALLVLLCLLAPVGCRDAGKQKAAADATAALEEANAKLEQISAELQATQKERDGLKKTVSDLSASLDDVKTKLAATTQARDKLQPTADQTASLKDQLAQLTRDRDAAKAKLSDARGTVEKLKTQVQEQIQKVAAAVMASAVSDTSQTAGPAAGGSILAIKTVDLGKGVSMDFVLIPPGTFEMGSADSEKDRDSDEGPMHKVLITKPFYIGKYEVTQAQYQAVMGTNPSKFGGPNLPVESVSWEDAAVCCRKLGGRLPTEAEWEYTCRAGTRTRFCCGDDPDATQLGEYAWFSVNSASTTHPVGQKKPNAFGLYDMHGNVYEWCSDWFTSYPGVQTVNPVGAASGQYRVCRGGGWIVNARFCRSANRHVFSPDFKSIGLGFRAVLDIN